MVSGISNPIYPAAPAIMAKSKGSKSKQAKSTASARKEAGAVAAEASGSRLPPTAEALVGAAPGGSEADSTQLIVPMPSPQKKLRYY